MPRDVNGPCHGSLRLYVHLCEQFLLKVQWKSSAYHRTEESYIAKPPIKPRTTSPKPAPISENDDSSNSVILFPGQGTQFVGMAKDLVSEFFATQLILLRLQ